ncbi:DUF2752 domain-containing protein [Akkermansiaceae bacterium]|nr:DUF2752 domain-containing protein [Akkermansiaceae bacterium]MDB4776660.1 DUF2752 domain-containing protein [Akkermansiaceae bacterium]MDC0280398.1 DUF2752 domain-containing protein [Akkermansiaceae bacterium]
MLLAIAPWLSERMPSCLFHEKTGLFCPGCGATRSALDLSNGDWFGAMRNNVLFVSSLGLSGVWIVVSAVSEKFPEVEILRVFRFRLRFLWWILATLIAFTLLRNIPAIDFLRPISQ